MKSPFRWVGGKAKLVPEIRARMPDNFGRYFEPFAGGASLLFACEPCCATLGDTNAELIETYRAIRDDIEGVLVNLRRHARMHAMNGRTHYLNVRDQDPLVYAPSQVAARMLYLNKTNFQGLYRVNAAGRFNVGPGKFTKAPRVVDEPNLRACSVALRDVELVAGDFEDVLKEAARGDFAYLDSPFLPTTRTSFVAYGPDRFAAGDHVRLATLMQELVDRGVHVIASNSDTPDVRDLYANFELVEVSRAGTVSSNPDGRQRVAELLILGTPTTAGRHTTMGRTKKSGRDQIHVPGGDKDGWGTATAELESAAQDVVEANETTQAATSKPKKKPPLTQVTRSRDVELTKAEYMAAAKAWGHASGKIAVATSIYEAAKSTHKAAVAEAEQTKAELDAVLTTGTRRVDIVAEWRPNNRTCSMELTDVESGRVLEDPETSLPEIRAMNADERQTWLPFGGDQPTAEATEVRKPTPPKRGRAAKQNGASAIAEG